MKPGDVVRPKGRKMPLMTVATVSTTGVVHCKWFVGKTLHRDNFSERFLRIVKERQT
jgi:uncharacterized protein YodC (DUF2158 family)